MSDPLRVRWLGRVPYGEALELQRALFNHGRGNHLLLLEHTPVYTLGVRADLANVLVPPASVGAELVRVDRGGDVTYHGPGQLTGYPILSLPGKRGRAVKLDALAELEYVAVRSHSETIRILQLLRLEHRVRLMTTHFLALPAIVRTTDLGVVMPRAIAAGFVAAGGHKIIEPQLPMREFTVALHWSRRYEKDPAQTSERSTMPPLPAGQSVPIPRS